MYCGDAQICASRGCDVVSCRVCLIVSFGKTLKCSFMTITIDKTHYDMTHYPVLNMYICAIFAPEETFYSVLQSYS